MAMNGYAPVNGLKLYYEIHGTESDGNREPLIFLHGGLGSVETFSDLQAHGGFRAAPQFRTDETTSRR
jgi:pimeloyl-ACP methyl ester carboxylesterase